MEFGFSSIDGHIKSSSKRLAKGSDQHMQSFIEQLSITIPDG